MYFILLFFNTFHFKLSKTRGFLGLFLIARNVKNKNNPSSEVINAS